MFATEKITYQDAIKVGDDTAKVKIVEYINLACPDALIYQETYASFLAPLVATGQVQRILKHYNKTSNRLQKGNVANEFIAYDGDNEAAYHFIDQYMRKQNEWTTLDLEQVAGYFEAEGFVKQDNADLANRVFEEAQAVGVGAVPTVFVGDQAFIETVDADTFKKAISSQL